MHKAPVLIGKLFFIIALAACKNETGGDSSSLATSYTDLCAEYTNNCNSMFPNQTVLTNAEAACKARGAKPAGGFVCNNLGSSSSGGGSSSGGVSSTNSGSSSGVGNIVPFVQGKHYLLYDSPGAGKGYTGCDGTMGFTCWGVGKAWQGCSKWPSPWLCRNK